MSYQAGEREISLSGVGGAHQSTMVDLQRMTQADEVTGIVRQVQRKANNNYRKGIVIVSSNLVIIPVVFLYNSNYYYVMLCL